MPYLLKKSLMENTIFRAVFVGFAEFTEEKNVKNYQVFADYSSDKINHLSINNQTSSVKIFRMTPP